MGGGDTAGYMGMDVTKVGILADRFREAAGRADELTVDVVAALDLARLDPSGVVGDIALLADDLAAMGTQLRWRADRLGAHAIVCRPFSPPSPPPTASRGGYGIGNAEAEQRVSEVMEDRGLGRAAALAFVRRIDADAALLFGAGLSEQQVGTALTAADTFGVSITDAVELGLEYDVGPMDALGWLIEADAFDMTIDELRAFHGLQRHFDVFDDATGGDRDGKVSEGDLRHVVDHAGDFTPDQVAVAGALLAHATLRARLDSAASNTSVLDTDTFGATDFDDRVISRADVDAFLVKATVNNVLSPFRDQIDVAADRDGGVDQFYSRADVERFIEDNDHLPAPVLSAARTVIDAGWFDRMWLERHRDDLATAAAVVVGTVAIVASGGTASLLMVGLVAAGTAGAVTVGINSTGDAEDFWDGSGVNTLKGGVIGFSMAGLPASWTAWRASTTPAARAVGAAELTAGASDVVSSGGVDLLVPERYEARVRAAADATSLAGFGTAAVLRTTTGPTLADRLGVSGSADGGVDDADRLRRPDRAPSAPRPAGG